MKTVILMEIAMGERVFLLDIGNTNTRCGLFADGEFVNAFDKPTKDLVSSDIPDNVPVAAATVVPAIISRLNRKDIYYVSHLSNSGIDLSLVDGAALGADRLANLASLATASELPAAIIDCGTALTLEALDGKKRFAGGIIAPGRDLQRRALNSYTAQLPYVSVEYSTEYKTFGRNTEDSIIIGTDYGIIGAVKEFMRVTRKELGTNNVKFYVVGGDADMLARNIPKLKTVSPNFTLLGVLEIWRKTLKSDEKSLKHDI